MATKKLFKNEVKDAFLEGDFDFVLRDEIFEKIINYPHTADSLHQYFKKSSHSSDQFEKRLAAEHPEFFVRAVRVNQYFLKSDRIQFLFDLELPDALKIHQLAWRELQREELRLWGQVQSEFKKQLNLPLPKILISCICWLENKRFAEDSPSMQIDLGDVYSFFIRLYFSEYDLTEQAVFGEDELYDQLLRAVVAKQSNPLQKLLDTIYYWVMFKRDVLESYCYDLSVKPGLLNGRLCFENGQEELQLWKNGEIRYRLNRLQYTIEAMALVEYLEAKKDLNIPKGRFPEDEDINRELMFKRLATRKLLADLQIPAFHYEKTVLDPDELLNPLLTHSINRLYRYEYPLDKLKRTSIDWREALIRLSQKSIERDIKIYPFILMSKREYLGFCQKLVEDVGLTARQEIIDLFSFTVDPQRGLNRFKPSYDVWTKPFIKLGQLLFCPTAFFANNDWFYGFAQAALNNMNLKKNGKVLEQSIKAMEAFLADQFKQYGFAEHGVKARALPNKQGRNGDVDVLVEDEQFQLCIQLKRPYFRLNLRDQYSEQIKVDHKAEQQLNEREQYLMRKQKTGDPKKQIVKWIVSTSFEWLGEQINGCLKVNYFELLVAIRYPKNKTLAQLIEYIEEEKLLQSWQDRLKNPQTPELLSCMILETGLEEIVGKMDKLF